MKPEQFKAIMDKLKAACAKEPTPAQYDVLVESIADNALTDAEIMLAYKKSRDAGEPWWPKPGEFLARARPPANVAAIGSEASTILQLILDHPLRYGAYDPENGTVYDRRKIEAHHGRAAGEAFGTVQGRIRTMETLADEKWVRVEFQKAYEAARADYGAPASLTPPSRRLTAPESKAAISGQTEEESKAAEAQKRFSDMIHGRPEGSPVPVDWDARRAELRRQAEELSRGQA